MTRQLPDIEIDLPSEHENCLKVLVGFGIYGDTTHEVARYLLMRALDDLVRAGVLKGKL